MMRTSESPGRHLEMRIFHWSLNVEFQNWLKGRHQVMEKWNTWKDEVNHIELTFSLHTVQHPLRVTNHIFSMFSHSSGTIVPARTEAFNLQDFSKDVKDQLSALAIGEEIRRGPGGPQLLRTFCWLDNNHG